MQKIAITGASGFVGQHLTKMFSANGYNVIAIKRELLGDIDKLTSILDGVKIVINLSGANIIARWSDTYKETLYNSRINTTRALVKAMQQCEHKPELFISTSAVGIYNNQQIHSETNFQYANDFLGNLCKDWENEALKANNLNIRTVIFRFGIVLGDDGGALKKMLLPFKMGVGGNIGDGKQAFSFIHIDDLKNIYSFVIENDSCMGAYNMVAPKPTTNGGLTKALGVTLRRPTILPVPQFVLNIIFSEGAKVLTDGQSVIPQKLQDEGFKFKYSNIEDTIENLIGEK